MYVLVHICTTCCFDSFLRVTTMWVHVLEAFGGFCGAVEGSGGGHEVGGAI
jgi:hypothetical protein